MSESVAGLSPRQTKCVQEKEKPGEVKTEKEIAMKAMKQFLVDSKRNLSLLEAEKIVLTRISKSCFLASYR